MEITVFSHVHQVDIILKNSDHTELIGQLVMKKIHSTRVKMNLKKEYPILNKLFGLESNSHFGYIVVSAYNNRYHGIWLDQH